MNYRLLLDTVVHLKPRQVVYQVVNKVSHPALKQVASPVNVQPLRIVPPIPKYKCWENQKMTFLNISDKFSSWNQTHHGMLWAYNLNYMDWLQQEGITEAECEQWIDKFIKELPQNYVGQDPYPIALRAINWIKVFTLKPGLRRADRDDSLYSQIRLLEKKLEYRLLGNHLLEDAYALFISSIYFCDNRLYKKASKLLKDQLKEQVLPDGMHYEQSPMYHCILLDRLLDCINFAMNTNDANFTNELKQYAERMLGHLESIVWKDKTIPLLNDSAFGIAPTPAQLYDYACRLGLQWNAILMKECGYRKMTGRRFEAIVDVGNITASYQPGHTHADTFNYELRIDGEPVIVDTGISTYDKTPRRQYERSTAAHNTVVVDGKDSSRVWGGFRVGKRCYTDITEDTENIVEAVHDGFGKGCLHHRKFSMDEMGLHIEDSIGSGKEGVNYIHVAPGWEASIEEGHPNHIFLTQDYGKKMHMIEVQNCSKIEILKEKISTEYNRFNDIDVLALHFTGSMKYSILDEN